MVIYIPESHRTAAVGTAFHVLYYISGILYYVSSVINPILYNIMSLKFRQAFKNTIFKPCRRKDNRQTPVQTFRFYSKPLTDSNNSALLKKNNITKGSPLFTFRGTQKSLTAPPPLCNGPVAGAPNASVSGGSDARMLPNGDVIMGYADDATGDPFDHIEMECKSLSVGEGRNNASNHDWRPYHSFNC